MSIIVSSGSVVIGPNIPPQGLLVYYDISNASSYLGTGDIVNNLTSYQSITGSLFNTPTYNSANPKNLEFTAASSEYLEYNIGVLGLSFTAITIASSLSSTWNDYGAFPEGGFFVGPGIISNGFTIQAQPAGSGRSVVYGLTPSTNGFQYIGTVESSNITIPNMYFVGFNDVPGNQQVIYGLNSTTYGGNFPIPITRTNQNLRMVIGKGDPTAGLTRYMNMKIYVHLLYNRKLSISEIKAVYNAYKIQYNLPT